MAAKPGRPPGGAKTGGRAKGTPNKATLARAQVIAQALVEEQLTPEQQAELTPLAIMLRIMRARDRAGDDAGALAAAVAAAPYCHSRLSSSDVHVTREDSRLSDEQLREAVAEIEAKMTAAGRLH